VHLLLEQARREVLDQQLEVRRIRAALRAAAGATLRVARPEQFSPLAFPIYADRLRQQDVSTESWTDRIARMAAALLSTGSYALNGSAGRSR